MASGLTPEQKARIEENRKHALEKRAARLCQISHSKPNELHDKHTLVKLTNHPTIEHGRGNNGASTSAIGQSNSATERPSSLSALSAFSNASVSEESSPNFQCNTNSIKKSISNYSSLNVNIFKSKILEHQQTVPNCFKTNTSGKPFTPINGICRLTTKDRFTIDIPYHQQTIDLFRTVNGKEYGNY